MRRAFYSARLFLPEYLYVTMLCMVVLSQRAPECQPGGHWTLRNARRSVDFDSTEIQKTAIQDLVCDQSLEAGWYRFSVNHRPAEMPTSCVEMNRCGTQAPVWLSLKDGPLPRPGEVRQMSACATWQFFAGGTKDCCLFRIPITVRNCGEYMIYFLQPTQGCMGYCAKVAPDFGPRFCPPGEDEVNGRCKASVPALTSRPTITPELVGSSVHLRCSFAGPPSGQDLGYQVVWARHIGHIMKAEIRQESTMETSSLVEMDGMHFRLGETFSCSVSTFRANYSHSRSTPKESESFYAGLKFSAGTLHVAENGEEHEVSVRSTVPIPCLRVQPGHRCGLPLVLSVLDPDSRDHEAPNVALSACRLALAPSSCTDDGCGRATFTLTAVTDFTRDGNRPSLVSASPAPGAPRLWRNYVSPALKVTVQDLPTSMCYSLTDPHVITLDGRRYENQQTGTFVLYRSLSRRFEVHARQWDCGSRHYAVACACGVAVREENEVAVFDMCNGQPQETRPQLTVKVLGEEAGRGRRLRILEANQGKKVTLTFPSGASVRADVGGWGMSLSVRAPGLDYGSTRGLCGTFDRNVHNDFRGSEGAAYTAEELGGFIESWRLGPGESLFDKLPAATRQSPRKPFCHCREAHSTAGSQAFGGTADPVASPSYSDCLAHDDVDLTSLFPSVDTTLEYIQSSQPDDAILDMSAFHLQHPLGSPRLHPHREDPLDREFSEDLLLSVGRPRRQSSYEFRPVFLAQSLTQGLAYFFPEDHQAEARPAASPRWPTPSGLTSAKALEVCQMALANSSVGAVCRDLLGRRLEEAVDLCILDLQLKDDLGWDEALVPYLENECERRLLGNRTLRTLELSTSGRLVTALRCPNFCSGNGHCTQWGCQCFPSHSFYDCSLAISQPVEVTDLESSGLCDIRLFDCRSIRVFGLGFIDSPDISCHATRLEYMNGVWIPGEHQRTKATFLSSKALDCIVPSLSSTAVHTQEFMMEDKPYARWKIRVTNDGSQYSEGKVLTIYDGMCQQCEALPSGLCKLKERTCNIDGMCFGDGDPNPSSPCLLCDPDSSTFSWSFNRVNEPPVFHRPQAGLQTFTGENFVFQLAASDPEGSALLFQLEQGPVGASISPAGLLIWSVSPHEKEQEEEEEEEEEEEVGPRIVRFTLSDECSAQSSHTVEIAVAPCGCRNGGTCITDVSFPAGSGRYLCLCPEGSHGDLCAEVPDGCRSGPCASGACVNTVDGYRCKCPAGLRGPNCMEDVNECESSPCFTGVQCVNSYGSYSCAPCPKGMLGNGTTCTASLIRATSAPHYTGYKRPDVILYPVETGPGVLPETPGVGPSRAEAHAPREFPGVRPGPPWTWARPAAAVPGRTQARPRAEARPSGAVLPGVAADPAETASPKKSPGMISRPSHGGPATPKYAARIPPGLDRVKLKESSSKSGVVVKAPNTVLTSKDETTAAKPEPGGPPDVSSTCASRPCFPGVLCVNRRQPHVGFVCGRCPPGLQGNGRVCTKDAKAAAGVLQPPPGKSSRSLHSASAHAFRLHLPRLPPRHGIKHLSSPVTRAGGGMGRREAITPPAAAAAPRHVARSPVGVAATTTTTTAAAAAAARRVTAGGQVTRQDASGFNLGAGQRVLKQSLETLVHPVLAAVSKTTPPAPQPRATVQSRWTLQPRSQISRQATTPAKPWAPPRPAAPLAAAPPAVLPYALPDPAEFSAEGDVAEHHHPEDPVFTTGVFLPAAEVGARALPPVPVHRTASATAAQSVSRSAATRGGVAQTSSCGGAPCHPGVPCEPAGNGGLHCGRCPPGFIGDGRTCRAFCRHTCGRNMECAAPNSCRCKRGYAGPGCQTAICLPECQNGGGCVAPGVCACPPGYHGDTCDKALCGSPCQNGGTCVGLQTCSCPYGFVGPRCETMVCNLHCHNGGQCITPDQCMCRTGWTGRSCETALCSSVCLNGGTCVGLDTCICPHGFYGLRCQNALCSPPCKNGGVCMRNDVCSCPVGYTGKHCDKSVCEPLCMNGGRCVGPGVCDCPSGWRGRRCDKPTCLQKCLNGGECVGSNTCQCLPGWQGMLCQTPHCQHICLYGSRCVRPNVCACRNDSRGSLCSRKLLNTLG